jgi:hypothetical protein
MGLAYQHRGSEGPQLFIAAAKDKSIMEVESSQGKVHK